MSPAAVRTQPLRRVTRLALSLFLLIGSAALAEGAGRGPSKADRVSRVQGVTTLLPMPDGSLVTVGGWSLRQQPRGGSKFEQVHRIKGDNLYRVAGHPSGALVASWEKDGRVHYFHGKPRQHVVLPAPAPAIAEVTRFTVQHLAFLPNGDPLVLMHGQTRLETDVYAAYRLAPATGKAELLYRVDGARLLTRSGEVVVFAVMDRPWRPCSMLRCGELRSVVAYTATATGVDRIALLGPEDRVEDVQMIWGNTDRGIFMALELPKGERAVLRWRQGEAKPAVRPFPNKARGERLFATNTGDVLRLVHDTEEGELELQRHAPDGEVESARLLGANDADTIDTDLHAIGARASGALWLHWGDFILLFDRDLAKRPRAHGIAHLLSRRDEWGGFGVYVSEPEALWIAVDKWGGRDLARLSLRELQSRSKPWSPPRMAADAD